MATPFAENPSEEIIKKELFNNAMKSNWPEVINIYNQHPAVHSAKITRSGDTALHIAIADGKESVVEDLVKILISQTPDALEIQNELGNTPLHLAAYLGNTRMCDCIATKASTLMGTSNNGNEARFFSKLMGIRNNDHETPFFVAVLHGRKDAFLHLHSFCENNEGYAYCRKRDGETILHSAISGEYFDLAFQIIHLYNKLLNWVNEQGFSPLHILASKPSAFRSGSHIRGFDKLIYHSIFVDELKKSSGHTEADELQYDDKTASYPENYQTCVGMFYLLRKIISVLLGKSSQQHDAEDPKDQLLDNKQESSKNSNDTKANAEGQQSGDQQAGGSSTFKAQGHEFFPKNYFTCFRFLQFVAKVMLVILGLGSRKLVKIREKKEKHIWSVQIMEKLLDHASSYEYENNGRSPRLSEQGRDMTAPYALGEGGSVDFSRESFIECEPMVRDDHNEPPTSDNSTKASQNNKVEGNNGTNGKGGKVTVLEMGKQETPMLFVAKNGIEESILDRLPVAIHDTNNEKKNIVLLAATNRQPHAKVTALEMEKKETPILIAAKNGIEEMVASILDRFPVAIHDMNDEKKNVVLLAVENRQPHVYKFLLGRKIMRETIFRKTDQDGNSALHLAAMLGKNRPWLIPGAALQMQWEIKWYEFVKNSMPLHFFPRYNKNFQTPRDIFIETHSELAKEGGEWLTNTSESCSVVAALIATVAFATSATVPGGVKSDSGIPTLQNEAAFSIFAISSLVALCFSVTSVVMFLAILTSRYQEKDFGKDLPRKLLVGLTSLFVSIAAMLLSFCAGHFFVLKEKLRYAAFPMYAITCLPVTFFAVAQFPLYFDLVKATIKKVPQRSSK